MYNGRLFLGEAGELCIVSILVSLYYISAQPLNEL